MQFDVAAEGNRTMRVTPDPVRTSRILANSNNFQSSRRSSEDSLEDTGLSRDLRVSEENDSPDPFDAVRDA